MKKRIKKYLKNPMLLVLVLILLVFTPQGLYSPGQSRNVGVVVALGIDSAEEGYEVSLLTFIPKTSPTFKETDSVISGRAESIAKALYNAQVALGRRVGLSHVKTTVLSQQLMQEDVTEVVDYLTRLAALSSSTVFIGTNGSAKELLSLSANLENNIGLDIEQVIGFNSDKLFVEETSLEDFYKGYYGRERASTIGFLPVVEEGQKEKASVLAEGESPSGGTTGSSGQDGGAGGGVESESQSSSNEASSGSKKYILNNGDAVLLKDGKMVEVLSLDQMNALGILNSKTKGQIVRVDDAEIDGQKHDITYRVREKNVRKKTRFENGYPILEANITLGMELMEIDGNHRNLKVRSEYSKLTPEIITKIDSRFQQEFKAALDILRLHSADVLGVGNQFFKENRAQYKGFVKNLEREDDFINHVIFKLNFTIEPN